MTDPTVVPCCKCGKEFKSKAPCSMPPGVCPRTGKLVEGAQGTLPTLQCAECWNVCAECWGKTAEVADCGE